MIDEKKLIEALKNWDAKERGIILDSIELEYIIDLIKEQPKIENSLGFEHFNLHADSTLKNMTKDELISYIHMLHHNWSCTDTRCCNTIEMNYELEKALDKACEMLSSNVTTKVHEYDEYGEFNYEIPDKTKNEWKEELLQDE